MAVNLIIGRVINLLFSFSFETFEFVRQSKCSNFCSQHPFVTKGWIKKCPKMTLRRGTPSSQMRNAVEDGSTFIIIRRVSYFFLVLVSIYF
jgi:hypothetical protein